MEQKKSQNALKESGSSEGYKITYHGNHHLTMQLVLREQRDTLQTEIWCTKVSPWWRQGMDAYRFSFINLLFSARSLQS